MTKSKPVLKVGGKVHVWWSTGTPGNFATVLAILPYAGHFPESYDCVLRLVAPNTHRGYLEMAYRAADFPYEWRYDPDCPERPW